MANEFGEISPDEKETISLDYLAEGLVMDVDELEKVKNVVLRKLRSRRKLCLVLDLDHTLLHTKYLLPEQDQSDMSAYEGDDIFQWELSGDKMVTKLRPFVRDFLEEATQMFLLYVYTMGTRDYAMHIVHEFLDPQGVYFGTRVITREDCTIQGLKGLDVVPVHSSVVLVLDDNECVWQRNLRNLILIDKYEYFSEEGGDHESEDGGKLRFALDVLTKLHSVYFDWYDRFRVGDVTELVQNHWEDFINDEDEGQQGKSLRVADECSIVTKKQRIC